MAGHRRSRGTGSQLPLPQGRKRLVNRRRSLTVAFAAATTPRERLKVAFDYADAAATRHHPIREAANDLVEQATAALISVGDQLLRGRKCLVNRRRSLTVAFAAATTPRERLKVAFDYADAAATRHHPIREAANGLVEQATAVLISVGNQLLQMRADKPLRTRRVTRNLTGETES